MLYECQGKHVSYLTDTTHPCYKQTTYILPSVTDIENNQGDLLLHADIIGGAVPGDNVRATGYWNTMNAVPNSHAAADPYRALSSLSSLCTRSLYKRALTQDDPVRSPHD